MNLDTGHGAFRKKPFGVMSFDERGVRDSASQAYRTAELRIAPEWSSA
jgi:hypothetical protein